MIDYVYNLMSDSGWVVPNTDGNFIHKKDESNWSTYQIALDGLYMAQPFFMEIANALDDRVLTADDFNTYSSSNKPDSDAIYRAVCNRMIRIGENLYDESTKLYNHAWGQVSMDLISRESTSTSGSERLAGMQLLFLM